RREPDRERRTPAEHLDGASRARLVPGRDLLGRARPAPHASWSGGGVDLHHPRRRDRHAGPHVLLAALPRSPALARGHEGRPPRPHGAADLPPLTLSTSTPFLTVTSARQPPNRCQ